VDQTHPAVTAAEVASDGLSVRLRVKGLVQGHVHDFHLPSLKSKSGETLLHDRAYYTLNEIPR
jgi:UDP-2,3-diacylglucosamine pyrophosphatase LpxH